MSDLEEIFIKIFEDAVKIFERSFKDLKTSILRVILKILILESLGHIRCKDGNGMGRLDDDMKLVWGHILPNCKLMGSRWEEDLMLSIIWER